MIGVQQRGRSSTRPAGRLAGRLAGRRGPALHWIGLLVLTVELAAPAGAQEPLQSSPALTDEQVYQRSHEIYQNVMSPFCPGRLLSDCPSSAARNLKADIKERIAKGEPAEKIQGELQAMYGDEIRAAPPASGIGLAAWITPFLFLIAGGVLLTWWLKRHREAAVRSEPVESPELKAAVQSEMERMRVREARR